MYHQHFLNKSILLYFNFEDRLVMFFLKLTIQFNFKKDMSFFAYSLKEIIKKECWSFLMMLVCVLAAHIFGNLAGL